MQHRYGSLESYIQRRTLDIDKEYSTNNCNQEFSKNRRRKKKSSILYENI